MMPYQVEVHVQNQTYIVETTDADFAIYLEVTLREDFKSTNILQQELLKAYIDVLEKIYREE